MSQFEYLNRISLGQYLPTGSIIHRIDPRSKILGYTILILALTLTKQITGLLAAIILIILLLLSSKAPITFALRGLLPPLPFITLLAILQLFITPHPSGDRLLFSYGILSISATSLRFAILLLIRFTGLILLLTLASVTLSTLEMIYGLDLLLKPLNKIGIRTISIAMVVQIMLRFIPYLAINAEKIAKSQASRGADWDSSKWGIIRRARQFLPLIIPLFSVSLQQADILANAMLARGYGSNINRTGLQEYRFTWKDLLFLILSVCAAWFILFLS
jgi:energy-coupling factor transport system permease protein